MPDDSKSRSAQALDDFFETASVGLHLVGPDGTILRANEAELALLGYAKQEYVGRNIAEFHADPEGFRDLFGRLKRGERVHEFPARMRCKDGSLRDVLITSSVRFEDGAFVHTRCFTVDVTARRIAEASLQESERRLRLALEAGRMGTWEWNIATGQVDWSPGLQALHGLEPGTFEGTFEAFRRDIVPEDRERVEQLVAETLRTGKDHHLEYRICPLGGGIRWVEGRGKLYRDAEGRPERMVGVCTDITARKVVEANLVARARQQQAVASLGEIALRERDLQRVFDRAVAMVAETLEVEYCKVLELMPGREALLLRAGVGWKPGLVGTARVGTGPDSQAGHTLACGAPVIVRDLRTEARFNGPALLLDHGVVSGMSCIIGGDDQGPWGVLGTHATRRVAFTSDDVSFLCSVANVLGHAIQRERAESRLREADRRKDEFIAMLSHELRNPLAPLRSALELMRLQESPAPDEKLHAMMERQVGHLVRMVDDLLEGSRVSRGTLELKRQPLELGEVLRGAVESAEPIVREAGHELQIELPPEPLWVEGDAVRLTQSFSNLLNNAARFTPRGGRIRLAATCDGAGAARLSVRDNGRGFAPEDRENLFEMFWRGHGSSGLGIGLALVRKLVAMHGGTIEANSEGVGHGAEFVVTLPTIEPPAARTPQAGAGSSAALRVLVADDNADAAETLAALLRLLGHEVDVAHDGLEAVEAAAAFPHDVILLDIGMPRLDGYGAAQRIRANGHSHGARIVALTGWGQEEDRRRAREAGFDGHLVKPADLEALRRVLDESLRDRVAAVPG